MAMTFAQQIIRIKNAYRKEHRGGAASARTMLDWAMSTGRYKLDLRKAKAHAAREFAEALATETVDDGHGHQKRVNLSFKTTQGWLWDQEDTISRPNIELHLAHLRRNVYGDIKHAVVTANAYNERHPDEEPLQFSLNFAADLADDGITIPTATPDLGAGPKLTLVAGTSARRRDRDRQTYRPAGRAKRVMESPPASGKGDDSER